MTRGIIIGTLLLLALWGLGGCWVLRQTEQRLEARAQELLVGEGARFDGITVRFSGQQAILEGRVASVEVAAEAQALIETQIHLSEGWGKKYNPVCGVVSQLELPAAPPPPDGKPTTPAVAEAADTTKETRVRSWAMICASGDKVRLAGAVSDVGTSAELASVVRGVWSGLKVTNMLRVDKALAPFAQHRATMKALPKPAKVGDDIITTTRGDGIWMQLPVTADELTVTQALSGVDVSIGDIANAMLGWRKPQPPAPPAVPSTPPASVSMVSSTVAQSDSTTANVSAPDASTPSVVPVTAVQPKPVASAKALGLPYIGWAIGKNEVTLFGSLLTESQKVRVLEAAERLFQPRVVNVEHLQVDPSRIDDGKSQLVLPAKLPSKPIGFLVAGKTMTEYPADVFDSEIVAAHKSIGVRTAEIATALTSFRATQVLDGKLAVAEPYVRLATDGKSIVVSGEVGDETVRNGVLAAVKSIGGGMAIEDALTVTPLVQVTDSLAIALRQVGKLDAGKPTLLAVRAGQAVRRSLVHAIYFATGSNRSIDQDRAVTEVRRVLDQFPQAKFEVVGHTDNVGAEEANASLSLKRAQGFMDYLIKATGIPADTVAVRGAGSKEPIAENATPKGRAMNRRDDVRVASYE